MNLFIFMQMIFFFTSYSFHDLGDAAELEGLGKQGNSSQGR